MAQGLCGLAAAGARALQQPATAPLWLLTQFMAGCTVLACCLTLGDSMTQLSGTAAFKLGAACSLVLGPGRVLLQMSMAAATADPAPAKLETLAHATAAQVSAVAGALALLGRPSRQPQALAAFAASTAKPSALLPWLSTVTQAVPQALSCPRPGEAEDACAVQDELLQDEL